MKLSIVIPCLNEKATIAKAIRVANSAAQKSFKPNEFEIVVADNGSIDDSLIKIAKQNIARIVHVPVRGYGAALHWGILKAKGEYVLFADADLSYDFKQLKRFVPYLGKKDLVLGSRFKGEIKPGAMPWLHRYVGTPALTWLIKMLYEIPITDSNSGMRMVKRKFYKKLRMHNAGMEWASELLLKTAINKGRYIEVPITLSPDQRRRPPHLLSWVDGWRHLKAIILLRPNSVTGLIFALFICAVGVYQLSFPTSFFFMLASFGLFLSLLAAKLLQKCIDGTVSNSVVVLEKLPVVGIALSISGLVLLSILILPNSYDGLKLIAAAAVVLLDVWVFHIETIKTHLMNRLPDKLS